ncbi:uncharacterized protein LOC122573242 [Bombus pyrosoma]|uniref:uncharacterized protein LOC122573242 n=1 Tax=Bombus pyrosoma TaxID=396416 RepID=UPI001CB8AFE9|nr:uncharacterized protein LOC122573242 [Bombus pyrosoma]
MAEKENGFKAYVSSAKAVKSIFYSLRRILQYLGLSRFREKECGIPVEKIVQGSAIKEMRKEKWNRECSAKGWKNMREQRILDGTVHSRPRKRTYFPNCYKEIDLFSRGRFSYGTGSTD